MIITITKADYKKNYVKIIIYGNMEQSRTLRKLEKACK